MEILVNSEAPVQEVPKNEKERLAPSILTHMHCIRHIRLDRVCATPKRKSRSMKKWDWVRN